MPTLELSEGALSIMSGKFVQRMYLFSDWGVTLVEAPTHVRFHTGALYTRIYTN